MQSRISSPRPRRLDPHEGEQGVTHKSTKAALTIAGSDPGGGAGIQADIRTFSALGVFPTSAITALTVQNLSGVSSVQGVPADLVSAQIEAVLEGFDIRAVKTGMLWSAPAVEAVAEALAPRALPLVIDPVMISSSGHPLLDAPAIDACRARLLPLATLITPNLDEACVLLDLPPGSVDTARMPQAAHDLCARFGCAVLLKGGHAKGDPEDILHLPEGQPRRWRRARTHGVDTHGTGCTLASAIAAHIALGADLITACEGGIAFLEAALAHPHPLTSGQRVLGHEHVEARKKR